MYLHNENKHVAPVLIVAHNLPKYCSYSLVMKVVRNLLGQSVMTGLIQVAVFRATLLSVSYLLGSMCLMGGRCATKHSVCQVSDQLMSSYIIAYKLGE